jgi:hypothetical protein
VRLVGGVARFVAHPGRQRISFIHSDGSHGLFSMS